MRKDQASAEIYTFRRFLQCGALAVDPSSIQKRPPPEPDILCATDRDEYMAFELVEAIDPALARWVNEQIEGEQAMRTAAQA